MAASMHLLIKSAHNNVGEICLFGTLKYARETCFIISYNGYFYKGSSFSGDRRVYI